jgi:hypothetical protein
VFITRGLVDGIRAIRPGSTLAPRVLNSSRTGFQNCLYSLRERPDSLHRPGTGQDA